MQATVVGMSGHSAATKALLPRPSQRSNAACGSLTAPAATSRRARCMRVGAAHCARARPASSAPSMPIRLSPVANRRDARAPPRRKLGRVCRQAGLIRNYAQANNVYFTAAPAGREFDAVDEYDARGGAGGGRVGATGGRIVIGQRQQLYRAPARQRHQFRGCQCAVRMPAVRMQVDAQQFVGSGHDAVSPSSCSQLREASAQPRNEGLSSVSRSL